MKTGKKIMAMLLCAGLILSFCAWAVAEDKNIVFTNPGTYSATATGRNGDVTLTVTYSENAIETVEAEHEETPPIGGAAIEEMIAQVLEEQTLVPDGISGATASSGAFLAALAETAAQAGVTGRTEKAEREVPATEYDVTEADVIIVGAGGAGLTAAYTAHDRGLSVILLEKSGVVGGNSLCAEMGINAAGSSVQEALGMEYATPEMLKEAQMGFGGRENLVDAYVDASGKTIDYLHEKLGIDFDIWRYPDGHIEEINPENPLESVQNDHPSGSGLFMLAAPADGYTTLTLVNALDKALENAGIVLYKNTEATELLVDENGRVAGVKAESADGREVAFSGKAVLLATGGFGQNHEMLVEANPGLANAITDEIAPTTGDGIRMAEKLGAKTVDMEYIQLFPHVLYGGGNSVRAPGGFKITAVFVNQDAQRYTTEGRDTSDATLAQELSYCIFTEEDLNDSLTRFAALGLVQSGDSPAELAEALGLDAAALEETVSQWNADCAAGKDSLFNNEVLKPLEGKLYGYRFGVGAHYMMGGLLINENTQVLNENEEPIPGLYAAGETTGGFHGSIRIDGSGVGDAFIFGHLAGEKIADEVLN